MGPLVCTLICPTDTTMVGLGFLRRHSGFYLHEASRASARVWRVWRSSWPDHIVHDGLVGGNSKGQARQGYATKAWDTINIFIARCSLSLQKYGAGSTCDH